MKGKKKKEGYVVFDFTLFVTGKKKGKEKTVDEFWFGWGGFSSLSLSLSLSLSFSCLSEGRKEKTLLGGWRWG